MNTSEHRAPGEALTVEASPTELATLRAHVAQVAAEAGADSEMIEDFQLVVSELATNVMLHTQAAQLSVSFGRVSDRWVLEVSNADASVDLDPALLPAPDHLSGRGLFVVQALMDSVELIEINGRSYIRCTKLTG